MSREGAEPSPTAPVATIVTVYVPGVSFFDRDSRPWKATSWSVRFGLATFQLTAWRSRHARADLQNWIGAAGA